MFLKVMMRLRALISDMRTCIGLLLAWRRVVWGVDVRADGNRALIVPCDPWGVVGSRGDQAMILAIKQHCGDADVDILTDSHETDAACNEIGLDPVAEWNVNFYKWMLKNASRYSEVYILGADVTDGVYGWPTAMKLLMFYDCFSRMGIKTHYLGFSWSETPSPWLHVVFPFLRQQLPLLVRDPVSYERVARFTRHRPIIQVADVAFQLKPKATSRAQLWIDWCHAQKKAGHIVVAVNVHQMFNEVETKSAEWDVAFARCLDETAQHNGSVVYLLVPHDNRPKISDLEILKRVNRLLPKSTLIDMVLNADEIKSVLGGCDALIAGRMHISIAAFGQCIPVFGLSYQGKFEGLWDLFGMPHTTLASPAVFSVGKGLVPALCGFIEHITKYRRMISERLPRVLAMSQECFK